MLQMVSYNMAATKKGRERSPNKYLFCLSPSLIEESPIHSMSSNTETYRFEGRINLHRGEIVKIYSTIEDQSYPIRVTRMENFTANTDHESQLENIGMANPPRRLPEPIIGRVTSSSDPGIDATIFTIEEGRFEDYVFIRAGQRKKARDLIVNIFENQLDLYVKICDNYVNVETIKLLSKVPPDIMILMISDNLKDKDKQDIQSELSKLKQHKVLIRKIRCSA